MVPGDQIIIDATLDSFRRGVAKGHVESRIDGEAAASAEFVIALPDVIQALSPKGGGTSFRPGNE